MSDLDQTLQERGNRYGTFMSHAQITQNLKELFRGNLGVSKEVRDTVRFRWDVMHADQREALDMLAHKVGRILNGDPHYADSWVDIAGYTKLVADRLLEDEKKAST
jgi:hypothetical protein